MKIHKNLCCEIKTGKWDWKFSKLRYFAWYD